MAKAFASTLDLKVEIIENASIEDVITALEGGDGHICAACLTQTKARQALFSPSYQEVTQQVVCRYAFP